MEVCEASHGPGRTWDGISSATCYCPKQVAGRSAFRGGRGSGQTPAGAGRHDVVSARRVTLEGGAEDAAVYGI